MNQNDRAEPEVAALIRKRGFTSQAVRAMLRARRMLALTVASAANRLRGNPDGLPSLYSRVIEGNVNASRFHEQYLLVKARLAKTAPRHRNHYSPPERYQILVHKQTYGLTVEETAEAFLVSEATVSRWLAEATREPQKKTIGSLLKAVPPMMGYSAVVRDLIAAMGQMGFGGNLKIAQTLARAGIKLNRETVRRWRKPRKPQPRRATQTARKSPGPTVRAKRPNHIWMLDITEFRGLLGLFTFRLAVVIDVFSRMPMTGEFFITNPTGQQMASLVEGAVKKHGRPKYLITDQGSQFTSDDFRRALTRLRVKQRFGAIGKSGSVAIIERFWRTVKYNFRLKLWPPITCAGLRERLLTGLYHYAHHRPHQGLAGATPAEIYYRLEPAHSAATRPRREYETNRSDDKLFEIAYLDPDRFFPVLLPKAA